MRNDRMLWTSSYAVIQSQIDNPPVTGSFDYVQLGIIYDCFNPNDVERHELQWRPGATVADYLAGLPRDANWGILLNGQEVEFEDVKDRELAILDSIVLVLIPQGGGGLKKILMAVAAIAVIAVGIFVPGMQWLIPIGVSMLTGLAMQMLMMPKKPKANKDDENSYGIDGQKNSATEGIPYPVGYGEFRVAGNFCDCYTQNVGDNQYLYLRTVLNDGEIDSISDIEINEQPLANFKDVQWRFNKGTLTEQPNDWFPSSIVQVNKGGILLDTNWTQHETSGAVDRVRFDVVFPEGLTNINTKTGSKGPFTVELATEYRLKKPAGQEDAWQPLPLISPATDTYAGARFGDGFLAEVIGRALQISASARAQQSEPVKVVARHTATNQETVVGTLQPTPAEVSGYVFDQVGDGSIAGSTNVTPIISRKFEVILPSDGEYAITTTGSGGSIDQITSTPSSTLPAPPTASNMSGKVRFTDNRAKAIRKSIESGTLPRGIYEVRIRRTTPENADQDKLDTVNLTDIAEIENDPVALRGTANLSLRIRLNDQLNAIPQLTAKAKLSLVRRYDSDGNVIDRVWSNNPAWISLDILLSPERGALVNPNRIDWPAWVEWADWCAANNITFNGIFDQPNVTLGDALREAMRVGQGAPVPFGTKISVAIDRPRTPVHVFTQGNILKDSFQITYLSMADRANEYEFSYFDKTDRNKQKTIRYVDPKAVQFSETPRAAQVALRGVDTLDRARREMWKAIYSNRLLLRTVSFDSWLDSINMTLGEVALIQHDMMDWADSGRLESGNTTTTLKLDQKVTLQPGKSFAALVHHDALQLATTTVQSVVGRKVIVEKPAGAAFTAMQLAAKRLKGQADVDFEIAKIENGSSYHTITLVEPAAGAFMAGHAVSLWDTDVVEERVVVNGVSVATETDTLTLATPLSAAPPQYAQFVFGETLNVRKPYVLTGISGNGLEKRKLTFIEYHEGVYAEPEIDIPVPVTIVTDRIVDHVKALKFSYDPIIQANAGIVPVRVSWNAGHIVNYGGADVRVSVNGETPESVGSAVNASEWHFTAKPGDDITVYAVAYNQRGDRAPIVSAPGARGTLAVTYASLDAPTGLDVEDVAFEVDGTVAVSWTNPVDMTGTQTFEVQYKRSIDANWSSFGYVGAGPVEISGLQTGTYEARVRSASATSTSVWVTKGFSVAIAPGSLMHSYNAANNRNGAAVLAPTLPGTGAIEHTLNFDGSANISLDWIWNGDNAEIDGFEIKVDRTAPAKAGLSL